VQKDKNTGLTPKQEKFVQEVVKGKTQRAAYQAAYDTKKMKIATIDHHACVLLKQPNVKKRYNELRGKVVARAEEDAIITREEIIKELADMARSEIGDVVSFRMVGGKPVLDVKDSSTIDTKNIKEIKIGDKGASVKMYGRDTALYKLADMFGVDKLAEDKQKLARERFKHDSDMDNKKYW
jgi:phage terminase small subunit